MTFRTAPRSVRQMTLLSSTAPWGRYMRSPTQKVNSPSAILYIGRNSLPIARWILDLNSSYQTVALTSEKLRCLAKLAPAVVWKFGRSKGTSLQRDLWRLTVFLYCTTRFNQLEFR